MKEMCSTQRKELEILDQRHKKLSGTSLMLRDQEHRYIYKIIPEYTDAEATFYAIANGLPIPEESRSYAYPKDMLKHPEVLVKENLIPRFYGVVRVLQEECHSGVNRSTCNGEDEIKYFEEGAPDGNCSQSFNAIKLENVLYNYESPAIIDIKLGLHNPIDNENYGGISASRRIAAVRRWQELKNLHKHENSDKGSTKRIYNITVDDLGLGEIFSDMSPAELDSLLKSWRQKIVASQTTEDEMGFRICSICITGKDGPLEISAAQAKLLKKEDTLNLLHQAFGDIPEVKRCMIEALVKLRAWIELQDQLAFSATSLLVTYDQNDPAICSVKWVDFTHVESAKDSHFSVGPSNMMKGIESLIEICKC